MTLAEALEPLYRAYLRRLDEMAARVPSDALLTETTTRGDDGRLIVGDDGLPLRFDVANRASGETFDVHGAQPDAPAAQEVSCARLQVRLQAGNWEELPVVCVFDGEPLGEDAESLAKLLASFGELASFGAFAGFARARGTPGADAWKGRLHGVRRVELRENEMWAVYDFGSAPPATVEALVCALSGWSEDRVPLAYVRIGGA